MSLGLDPAALFIALLALWYTIRESRRNNSVLLRVCECEGAGCQSVDENDGNFYYVFRVVIRNQGIALHDASVKLAFQLPDWGTMSFTMNENAKNASRPDEFGKGMMAEFFLKSYHFDARALNMLAKLEDPVKQRARLRVFSQGYLAKEIRIGSWSERMKLRWNGPAQWINGLFDRGIERPGDIPMVKTYKIVPVFQTLLWPLSCFARFIRQHEQGVHEKGGSTD